MPLLLKQKKMTIKEQENKNNYLKNVASNFHHFVGCGNELGIVPLTLAGYPYADGHWKTDPELRKLLAQLGKGIKSDSVMVLMGDPRKVQEQGFHVEMTVFEPNGNGENDLEGGLSNMCGNGVRAVADWVRESDPSIREILVQTGSGLRKIIYEPENNVYVVQMGELTTKATDLAPYVNGKLAPPSASGHYLDAPIPDEILKDLSQFVSAKTWSIGLNGSPNQAGIIDGEPHVIIEITSAEAPDDIALRKLAVAAGPIVTKNLTYFPQEICVNFIVVQGKADRSLNQISILNSTHERNLGDDADHSVTAACGTGSTVAGGIVMEKYMQGLDQSVLVKNTGGELTISPDPNLPKGYLMKGEAHRVV